jgi:hypothetical protein
MSLTRSATRPLTSFSSRHRAGTIAVIVALGLLPTLTSLTATSAVAVSKNANFIGTWELIDPADPSTTATLVVSSEDDATGSFTGTLAALGNIGPAFDAPFDILDGRVSGNAFSFNLERTDIGIRAATYKAHIAGSISGNDASGSLNSTIEPPIDENHNAFVGFRSFTAKRNAFKLSGTIIYGCAGGATCGSSAGPLYDVNVDVQGPASDSATTDTKGKWSVSVPPGHYTITPTAPDVTFTPASIDVDVSKATPGQDFTSCVSTTGNSANVRAPLAQSTTWSLSRKTCYNSFAVNYFTATRGASVSWTILKYICNPGPNHFYDASLGREVFSYRLLNGSSKKGIVFKRKNGDISIIANNDQGVDVLDFLIKPGGATGSVTTHVSTYVVSINNTASNYNCAPVSATDLALPGPSNQQI